MLRAAPRCGPPRFDNIWVCRCLTEAKRTSQSSFQIWRSPSMDLHGSCFCSVLFGLPAAKAPEQRKFKKFHARKSLARGRGCCRGSNPRSAVRIPSSAAVGNVDLPHALMKSMPLFVVIQVRDEDSGLREQRKFGKVHARKSLARRRGCCRGSNPLSAVRTPSSAAV